MAVSTPRPWQKQPAAAAAQLRGGGGRGPQRVYVASVSTALETSAAARAIRATEARVRTAPVAERSAGLAI